MVTFPTWATVLLVVAAAALTYSQTQTEVVFTPLTKFAIGVSQVAVAALLGFQKAVVNTGRRLRGRPALP